MKNLTKLDFLFWRIKVLVSNSIFLLGSFSLLFSIIHIRILISILE